MKNLPLSLAMLMISTSIFAQLYVTPNTASSTDSYIYVDDEILYVEQDINLVENTNDPATEASIYFRNDGQLMQGGTSSSNTGTGYISIYQESNSDAYDYNYWCSPVSVMNGTGNRNFGLPRMYDEVNVTESNIALTTTGYNGASTPLTISTRWFYRWNPVTQRWLWNGTGHTVGAGYGFIMKGTDVTAAGVPETQNQRYDFRGRPHSGDLVLPIQFGVVATDGNTYNYTLTGNPYPSALNLYAVFNDADNVEIDSFKFWDEDRTINSHYYIDNKGGYGTYLPGLNETDPGTYVVPTFLNYDSSGAPSGGSTGSGSSFERLNAPVGQGFMVMVDNIGDGQIVIKNSHRRYIKEGAGTNSEFRNPTNDNNSSITGGGGTNANVQPQIRVQTFFGDNDHMRDMVLLFNPLSTDGYDRGMDATHPMDGATAEAYFKIGNSTDTYKNLVIQTVPFEPTKQVPIAFELEEQTKFYVKVTEQINTPFEKAYLYDSVAGTYQEITESNDAVYLLPAGTYEDRFYITFRGAIQDRQNDPIVEAQKELLENVDFFQNNRIATLEVTNPEGYDIKTVNIFDMNGKLVLTQENLGTQRRLSFPTANFSDGIYLVKLTTVDNFAIDYKITVFNK
jgi:hypothetical protein